MKRGRTEQPSGGEMISKADRRTLLNRLSKRRSRERQRAGEILAKPGALLELDVSTGATFETFCICENENVEHLRELIAADLRVTAASLHLTIEAPGKPGEHVDGRASIRSVIALFGARCASHCHVCHL